MELNGESVSCPVDGGILRSERGPGRGKRRANWDRGRPEFAGCGQGTTDE